MPPIKKKRRKPSKSSGPAWRPIAGVFALILALFTVIGVIMNLVSRGLTDFGVRPLVGSGFFISILISVGITWLRNETSE